MLSEDEVMTRLAPHLPFLASLPGIAVERYKEKLAPVFFGKWPTVRAGEIQALMVEAMRGYCGKHSIVDMVEMGQRWLWPAATDLVVQFKMLDKTGRPSNYPTERARNFDAQMELDGFPPGMRVTLGYTLDEETIDVVDVRVVAQDGPRISFSRLLSAVQEVLPFHTPVQAPTQTPAPRRLQPSQSAEASAQKKQTSDGESGKT